MPQLVYNERIKFVAAALDRASTGCFVIGVLGPVSAIFQGQLPIQAIQIVGLVTWFLAGSILRLRGYMLVGRLVDDRE
jgi:hypothetical protein